MSVSVINERLRAVADGYLQAGSTADQHTGLLGFLTAIARANGGQGGSGVIEQGEYHMGSVETPVICPPTNGNVDVQGELVRANPNSGGTILKWDLDPRDVAPHTRFALDMTQCKAASLRGLAINNQSGYLGGAKFGTLPNASGGVRMGPSSIVEECEFNSFSTAIGWGGGTKGGFTNDSGYDHADLGKHVFTTTCGIGLHLLPGSISSGDNSFEDLDLNATCAAIAMAASASSGFGGTTWARVGCYAPVTFLHYDDGTGVIGGGGLVDNDFSAFSAEFAFDAVIYDELWQSPGRMAVSGNVWPGGQFYKTPQGTPGWQKTFPVLSASANQLTVQDTIGGYWFRKGHKVTDPASGASIGWVTAVAGSWPWTDVTLTLDRPLPATPPSSVTVGVPKIATVVAGQISDETLLGKLTAAAPNAWPLFAAGGAIHDVRADDCATALRFARGGTRLCIGGVGPGVRFGDGHGSSLVCSGQMAQGQSCQPGDLLMRTYAPGWADTLALYDGSRPPCGTALQAAQPGWSVDYQALASCTPDGYGYALNKTGTAIPAGTLIMGDVSRPGGVVVADSRQDAIGIVGQGGLPANGGGQLAGLWLG